MSICFSVYKSAPLSLHFAIRRLTILKTPFVPSLSSSFCQSVTMASSSKTIGTHDGHFHCDEALACYMLHQTDEYRGAKIVRTRDEETLKKLDIVVDVGGVYDPATHRYDHHQRSFNTTFDEHHKTTRLSSAGLIYKHFGKEIVAKRIKDSLESNGEDRKEKEVERTSETVYQRLYNSLIESVDAIDNGVNQYKVNGENNQNVEIVSAYSQNTNLSSRVGRLNPGWNEKDPQPDVQFEKAVAMVGEEFENILHGLVTSWLPARSLTEEAIDKNPVAQYNKDSAESNYYNRNLDRILVMRSSFPWKSHLFDIEKERNLFEKKHFLYVLYPDSHGKTRVQAVPAREDSFESRLALPAEWRGLRNEELSEKAGIRDCIFVHASGFIGAHETEEGGIEMALKAMEIGEKEGKL